MRHLHAFLFVIAATVIWPVSALHAHEGDGTLTIEASHPDGSSVHYIVSLVFTADAHPASDATVTAVAEDANGNKVGPVAMDPGSEAGLYEAVLEFPAPGSWTVRFTAVTPAATAETVQEISAAVPSTTGSTEPPSSTLTSPVTTDPDQNAARAPDGGGGGGGTGAIVALVVALLLVGVVAAVVVVVRRRAATRGTGR